MNRAVQFYRLPNGHCPIEEFLDSLKPKQVKKVTWLLRLVEEVDLVSAQYLAKMAGTDDIWECRVRVGSESYKLEYFKRGANA